MTDETNVITPETAVDRFVNIFREIDVLNQDAKALTDEVKEADLDVTTIKAVAKLLAAEKAADWEAKTKKVQELLDSIEGAPSDTEEG